MEGGTQTIKPPSSDQTTSQSSSHKLRPQPKKMPPREFIFGTEEYEESIRQWEEKKTAEAQKKRKADEFLCNAEDDDDEIIHIVNKGINEGLSFQLVTDVSPNNVLLRMIMNDSSVTEQLEEYRFINDVLPPTGEEGKEVIAMPDNDTATEEIILNQRDEDPPTGKKIPNVKVALATDGGYQQRVVDLRSTMEHKTMKTD